MTERQPPTDHLADEDVAYDDELDEYDGYGVDDYDDYDDADVDYVDVPARRRGRRILAVVAGLLVVGLLALGAAGFWVQRQIDPAGSPGPVKEIVIPEGATSDDIGRLLTGEGIIANETVWRWYLRINGGGPFQAGFYELAADSAIPDVIDILDEGPRPPEERTVTIPEGLTTREILARLADPEVGLAFDLAVMQQLLDSGEVSWAGKPSDQPSHEGILFPETYRIAADADEAAVLRLLVGQLDQTMTELGLEAAQARLNLTAYELLIVASLVEEESKVPEERPMMAQVIYNRIRQGVPLGIDATSRYEAEIEGRTRDQIDFESDSPYNTRRVAGLPPTPIASPGRASIEAALNPAEGDWLYYVLEDAEGRHFFTASYNEFLAAKERCRQAGLGCG